MKGLSGHCWAFPRQEAELILQSHFPMTTEETALAKMEKHFHQEWRNIPPELQKWTDSSWLNATVLVCCSLLPNMHWSALTQNYTPAPQCWQTNSVCPGGPLGFDRGHWSTVILIQHQFKLIVWLKTRSRALSWVNTWETDFWHNDTCQVHDEPKAVSIPNWRCLSKAMHWEAVHIRGNTAVWNTFSHSFKGEVSKLLPILSFIWTGCHLQGRSEPLAQEKSPCFELQLLRSKKVS